MPPLRGSDLFYIFPGVSLLRSFTPGYFMPPRRCGVLGFGSLTLSSLPFGLRRCMRTPADKLAFTALGVYPGGSLNITLKTEGTAVCWVPSAVKCYILTW